MLVSVRIQRFIRGFVQRATVATLQQSVKVRMTECIWQRHTGDLFCRNVLRGIICWVFALPQFAVDRAFLELPSSVSGEGSLVSIGFVFVEFPCARLAATLSYCNYQSVGGGLTTSLGARRSCSAPLSWNNFCRHWTNFRSVSRCISMLLIR